VRPGACLGQQERDQVPNARENGATKSAVRPAATPQMPLGDVQYLNMPHRCSLCAAWHAMKEAPALFTASRHRVDCEDEAAACGPLTRETLVLPFVSPHVTQCWDGVV
jgi:hypothetical protein